MFSVFFFSNPKAYAFQIDCKRSTRKLNCIISIYNWLILSWWHPAWNWVPMREKNWPEGAFDEKETFHAAYMRIHQHYACWYKKSIRLLSIIAKITTCQNSVRSVAWPRIKPCTLPRSTNRVGKREARRRAIIQILNEFSRKRDEVG